MRIVRKIAAFLHLIAKMGWWMGALSFMFLALPLVATWTNNLILSIPIKYAEMDLWPFPWTINFGVSNHDFIGLVPLWFLCSGLGIVAHRYYKVIWWFKNSKG